MTDQNRQPLTEGTIVNPFAAVPETRGQTVNNFQPISTPVSGTNTTGGNSGGTGAKQQTNQKSS